MGFIKDQIKEELKLKIKDSIAKKQQEKLPPEKTVGGFVSNIGKNITAMAKGIVGLGYQAVRHPIESAKTVGATSFELAKEYPKAAVELPKQIFKTVVSPVKTTKEFVSGYKKVRAVPFEEQKKFFDKISEEAIKSDERGKRVLGALGSGLIGAFTQEITHPLKYAYENPVSFALDVLSVGKTLGVGGILSGVSKNVLLKVPAVSKMNTVLKEVFTPHGKLIDAGFDELAKDFSKTKSEIFKIQKQIVEDTSNKFYKEFKLSPKEQIEFFETIDKLRRVEKPVGEVTEVVKVTSKNAKIQSAINWWLDEEAPKLAKLSGLPEERVIQNYLHHFFPEKFKPREVTLAKPLQFAKRGYLKKSEDVEGFTKDPVLSISAIKSKVAIDNIKDNFIKNTIDKYAVKIDTLSQQLKEAGIDIAKFSKEEIIDKTKKLFDLEEYKPKGSLRFFPAVTETGSKIAGVTKRVETHLMPKVIVEELNKFTTGGKNVLEKLFLPFDVFNRNWKPLATALRPRYHTRNILGNIYNSTIVAGNNPISFVLKDLPMAGFQQIKNVISTDIKSNSLLGKIYKKLFGDVIEPEIIKTAVDNDVIGRGFFGADVNDLVTAYNKGDDIMKTIKSINTPAEIYKIPVLKQWLELSTKVGQFLEDNARLALFKKGMKIFKGNVEESKLYVNKHLFDYLTGLGDADKIIKRFIPFWSWTRFNIPLQTSSLLKTPLRYVAIQRGTEPYVKESERKDEGYQYLTPEQQSAGFLKIGTAVKGGKEYDKYIKTASVIPLDDVTRLIDILKGKEEEIGITPLKQIYELITSDPTKFKNYFGQSVESFPEEKKKFLGLPIRGRTKELLSVIPVLTELNKAIGGSYVEKEKPAKLIRAEQVLSPLGVSLIDRENSKFFSELDKQKELTGSYTSGLEQMYKKYLKMDMKFDKEEKYVSDNVKILETILMRKGLTKLDMFKIKNKAIKGLFQDALKIKK